MSSDFDDLSKKAALTTISTVLWLLTTVLGVVGFLATRSIILRTYVRFFPSDAQAAQVGLGSWTLLNMLIAIFLALVLIAVIIGGAEYHYRHVGQPSSWKLFGYTLAVELSILALASFI